jgi:hypothetical protein
VTAVAVAARGHRDGRRSASGTERQIHRRGRTAEIASRLQLRDLHLVDSEPVSQINMFSTSKTNKAAASAALPDADDSNEIVSSACSAHRHRAARLRLGNHRLPPHAPHCRNHASASRGCASRPPRSAVRPANRIYFSERLETTIAQVRKSRAPAAVLYVDLDHFKDVNDTPAIRRRRTHPPLRSA